MFKLLAVLFWLFVFVLVYKIVWVKKLKPYLDKEMNEDASSEKKDEQ